MLEPERLRENVHAEFRSLLGLIEDPVEQSHPDIEGKITVASETWHAGHSNRRNRLVMAEDGRTQWMARAL